MNEDLTTQELSKKEKQRLAEKCCYEKNREKRLAKAREYYLNNKDRFNAASKMHYTKTKKERHVRERIKYNQNKRKFLDADRIYRQKNKEKINEYLKLYRENNREKICEGAKASYQKHRDKRLKETQAYEQRPDVKLRQKVRHKQRYSSEPEYKLRRILRNQLYQHLRINKTKKSKSALKLVGCDISTLRLYIESQWLPGMSWNNYTTHGWHVDHIRPVNTFNLRDPIQQKECFHYTNLRPLWAKDNLSRPDDGSDLIKSPK